MAMPDIILDLIERFERNLIAYKSGSYNETQVRREFIDPFFEALGWDVNNREGNAEAYKDVIHEDAVKVGGITKAPDYSFRIGGQRKFFVEAKKPSIAVKDDPAPAFQVRRYAWSAKLPLSIVTDFEELAVYDCRIKPDQKDKADKARVKYYTFRQYAEKWDEIAAIFSKNAILKGSFDKYAESHKAKRGTAEVDSAFLEEIESWRDTLARNIALRNTLTVRELNEAVQRTIDRIIFLRIAEDRGIEEYGGLRGICNGPNTFARLRDLFYKADDRYNSGLFHFRHEKGEAEPPDSLTISLTIDDKPLKDILKRLYYPDSPYEFAVLPADILGQVYEQFLGKVIRLTSDHRAVVEDKPEVKKAGGVFYTPTYIVEYIVKNTVGKLLDGKTPKQAESVHILDPACGSGSFLLGAYQYLLDWHLVWYVGNDPEKWAKQKEPRICSVGAMPCVRPPLGGDGSKGDHKDAPLQTNYRLTTAERKRILLNNIYGVDIDSQAVEVTKLSLLLKVLEGETGETLNQQMRLFHERALPDLGSNIKCGNSLIGPDFYDGRQMNLMADEEMYRVNVFDWEREFAEVFKAGGFDAVIGNPPYVRQESLGNQKDYLKSRYAAFDGVADLYVYFMEKGIRLLRTGGIYSIIVSSSFLRTRFAAPLRGWLKGNASIERIVDFGGLPVFANAKDVYVCIPTLRKSVSSGTAAVCHVPELNLADLQEFVDAHSFTVPLEQLTTEAWSLKGEGESALFAKVMTAGVPLGQYVEKKFFRGITSGLNEAFVIDDDTRNALIAKDPKSAELIKPLLGGEEIRRFVTRPKCQFIIFTRRGVAIDSYPAIREHLNQWQADLTPKQSKDVKRGRKPGRYQWYEIQDDVAYYRTFESPKIIYPDICKEPRFVLDADGHYLTNTAYCLGTDDRYLLGILNSRLFWFAISHISIPFGVRAGEYRYRLIYQYMEKVPIRPIDFSNPADKARHERMVQLVEQMLELQMQLPKAKTGHDQTLVQRQIDVTDRQIDKLAYELYGLTEEEIAMVGR